MVGSVIGAALTAALTKGFSAGETAALLAAGWASALSPPDYALRLCILRLLRDESARVEKDHAASVDFGRCGGVRVAVQALDSGTAAMPEDELRIATEAAAALANLVAAAGANKQAALELGGVGALVRCVERYTAAWSSLAAGLCTQACRALGNLTFGWDVEPVKRAVGERGVAAIVGSIRRAHEPSLSQAACSLPLASLFRWQAHALRNLVVRSAAMQAAIGEAGGVAALVLGLRTSRSRWTLVSRRGLLTTAGTFATGSHPASARAQEAGCKALAYVCKEHEANCAAAATAGAFELVSTALATHAADAGVAEAGLAALCYLVGMHDGSTGEQQRRRQQQQQQQQQQAAAVAARAARAVGCGAHLAALGAMRAILSGAPASPTSPTSPTSLAHHSTGVMATDPATAPAEFSGELGGEAAEGGEAGARQAVRWGALALAAVLAAAPAASAARPAQPGDHPTDHPTLWSRACVAAALEEAGLRRLLEGGVARRAQRRGKVKAEVLACLQLLAEAGAPPPAPPLSAALSSSTAAPSGSVYSFDVGIEEEAAGRTPPSNFLALRRDLAALPWVLARAGDVVRFPSNHGPS